MDDGYTRQRLDKIADDSASTRATVEAIRRKVDEWPGLFADHEQRLRAVEQRTSRLQAIGGVLAVIFTTVIGLGTALLKKGWH